MKRFSFVVFMMGCLLFSNRVFAQEASEIVQTDVFYYALPENYFEVKVSVQKETFHKGPLTDYSGGVIGLSSIVKENKVQYKILYITIKEYARGDRDQLYKLKPSFQKQFIYLNSGLLEMGRKDFPNLKSGNFSSEKTYTPDYGKTEEVNRFPIYTADAVMERYDTTYMYEIVDSVLVQVPTVIRSLMIKPSKRQAEDAMDKLDKIREVRWALISGDHEIDYSKLDVMLAELQKMENDYLALFSGTAEKEEQEYTFLVCPMQKNAVFSLPLFRFSITEGITEKEIGTVSYALNFKSVDSQNELIKKVATDTQKQKKKIDISGATVYYRQPHVYTLSLIENGKQVQVFGDFPIAQLGEILSLPKGVKRFQLDPFTGGLKFVKF